MTSRQENRQASKPRGWAKWGHN